MTSAGWNETMPLFKYQKPAIVIGGIAAVLTAIGAVLDHDQFFRSYLVGFVFIASLSVGSLGILMLQYLTGGAWGIIIRRPLEAATRVLPLVALAFLPVAFGLHSLYHWSHADAVAKDHLLQHKAPYLNVNFFYVRTAIYFALWILAAYLLNRWSLRQQAEPSEWRGLKIRHVSAAGLLVLALTLTFAAVDWVMSLEPHWFSTMFGISFMIGNILTAFAFAIVVTASLSRHAPVSSIVKPTIFRDLGNLMFAFIMLWAYTAFSEFLLIWYGNLREEVPWYLVRAHGSWGVVSVLLMIFHFFLPFVVLLMRDIKDKAQLMGIVASIVLFMRAVHVFWLIAPTFGEELHMHWLDPVAVVALFSLWFFFFLGQLKRTPLIPLHEDLVREALDE